MYFEEFQEKMEWQLGTVEIPREEMLEYGRKYDSNPVHVDEEYGKRCRFGDIIAPGTMTGMKLWNEWIAYAAPGEEFVAGTSCTMEWHKPVFAGDSLHGKAVVTKKTENSRYNGIIQVTIYGYNQNDEHVLTTYNHLVQKRTSVLNYEKLREALTVRLGKGMPESGDYGFEKAVSIQDMTDEQLLKAARSLEMDMKPFEKSKKSD